MKALMTKLLKKLYEANRQARIWNEAKQHYYKFQKSKYLAIAKEQRKIAFASLPKKEDIQESGQECQEI